MSPRFALQNTIPLALATGCLSGFLLFLAFPPADLGLLGFVALAPLSWFFLRASPSRIALAALAFGLSFFGPLIWWIALFGPLAYSGLVAAQTLWVVAALSAGHLSMAPLRKVNRSWGILFAFPLAFFAGEYLRTHLPLGGFGWGGLGYTQHDNPIALRLAPFTGVWGLSFVLAAINTLLAEAVARLKVRPKSSARLLAAALALALAPALIPEDAPDGNRARVAMVQGNVPEGTVDPGSDDFQVLASHLRLTSRLKPGEASLVVWPEGAFDRDPSKDDSLGEPLVEIVREKRSPFLVGAILFSDLENRKIRNTSLFFQPDGKVAAVYAKQHPVPFGEFVPLRSLLTPLIKELERVPYDQVPGKESTVFTLPEGKFASVICYESTYPALVRSFVRNGARLLVVSTNNSSFERSPASQQHVVFSQVRAAEHRMWVAHAALSGISAVVRPDGRVVQRSELFEPELLMADVRFATGTTLYAKLGDWLPALVLLALFLLQAAEISSKWRNRSARTARRAPGGAPAILEDSFDEGAGHTAPEAPGAAPIRS